MKKAVAALIAIIMTAGLCGCTVSVNTPEGTVEEFLGAIKDKDAEVLILYTDNNDINTLINNTADEEVMKALYNDLTDNLSWKIVSVNTNDEQTESVVKVEITNADFSKVLANYKEEAVKYMMYNLYDDDVTKSVMRDECMKIFAQQIKNASEGADNLVTSELEVKLTKNDSYTWDMEVTKELTKAVIGGLKWPAK